MTNSTSLYDLWNANKYYYYYYYYNSEIMVTTYPPTILHGIQSSLPQYISACGCLSDV